MVFSAKYGRIRVRGDAQGGKKKARKKKDSKIFSKNFHFWKASHTNKVQKLNLL